MDKKEILSNATHALQKKPNLIVRAWRWTKRQAAAFWRYLRGLDKLAFFNIALLMLVCAMLFVMFGQVSSKTKKTAVRSAAPQYAAAGKARAADGREKRVRRPERPTLVVARNGAPMIASETLVPRRPKNVWGQNISLPIRRNAPAVAKKKSVPGTLMIDGHGRKANLSPMTTVGGDLILQNMRAFTLPCGVRINGNLMLRNVKLLKFCGCFDIAGNIYVSSDSSFGPIPKNAYLGGQVIF
ncbi:MAG: hypothetical protein LBL21_00030 [Rickettsiales bacterium]|jgi:hypothetical protein|nr:hypothetical protein [Rickettsiales bacterium]